MLTHYGNIVFQWGEPILHYPINGGSKKVRVVSCAMFTELQEINQHQGY